MYWPPLSSNLLCYENRCMWRKWRSCLGKKQWFRPVSIMFFSFLGIYLSFTSAVHPEMQYLQKEMTKRRDKRLELATRKRSYEVTNATKRRKADEDGVWSWWKVVYTF